MSLSSICIQRPVLTIVMSILIVLFGAIGYTFLGVREYPSVDPPIITVTTNYTGANPDVIESQITEPLEQNINGVAGIRSITSTSSLGISNIIVEFNLNEDLEAAANDVRDRVSRAARMLPTDLTNPPVVTKSDANSDAIITMTVSSDTKNNLEVCDYAERFIQERLETIPGVSQIQVWGEKKYAIRLWMDPQKMAAYQLAPLDVDNALTAENVELPSGKIRGNTTELMIKAESKLKTPEEFNNMVIKQVGDQSVRMKDIGYAELGPENYETILKQGGVPMIGLSVVPLPGANYIDISDEFYRRFEIIKKDIPKDYNINVALDTTKFIRRSISEVQETLLLAFCLVILVIFLFLRDWRSTIIPVIAIPISLISAFFIMYIAGFSINVLTLLAIVLATGLVVDDAIVVLENIYSKVEKGADPIEASHRGSKEIFFAIISTTLTLAAVFLPIIFLQGFTGRLFREFGITLAGSIIVSAFVSLTLTPMMSSRMLRHREHQSWFYEKTEPFFNSLINSYRTALGRFMGHRQWSFIIIFISIGIIFLIGATLKSELSPLEDRNLVRMTATSPEGSSFDYMSNYMDRIVKFIYDSVPDTKLCYTVTAPGFSGAGSVNRGVGRLVLIDANQREPTQQQITDYLSGKAKNFTGAQIYFTQEQSIGTSGAARTSLPVQFVVQNADFDKLQKIVPKFYEEVSKDLTFQVVDVNLKFNKPELNVSIDRDRARDLGVSAMNISQTLQYAYSEPRLGYYTMNGEQYQIIGQVTRENRDKPLDLRSLYVKNDKGELIQMDNLVKINEQSSPPQLYHYNRYKSATFSAGLAKGKALGDGIEEMRKIAKKLLDPSFSTSLTGISRDFAESSSNIIFAFLLALVLIYLVLSAQFESFSDPFTIMLTVPLAIAGAVLSLWYFSKTLNIFSEIGIIMLIGLVTKNGILIVEFANQRKAKGLTVMEAVQEAAVSRFRPILMTSLATVLGALPIALALGAGAKSRVSMGIVVIGGLLFSLILTLFVIPAMYSYLTKSQKSKVKS